MLRPLAAELAEFLTFVKSLDTAGDEVWFSPLSAGKWSIHDIIAHIMRWDDYFNEVTFRELAGSESPALREHPDYLGYNEQSVAYGRTKTRREVVEETLRNRRLMIDNLNGLMDAELTAVYQGEREFTLESYIREFFVAHDRHHAKQIQDYIRLKRVL